MNASRCAAALLSVLACAASVAAQNRPVIFGGVGATGYRPQSAPPIPGWNVPRLYPSIGGGFNPIGPCGFGPLPPVNMTVFNFPPPLYASPMIIAPPVEAIELGPTPNDPRAVPPVGGQAAGRFRPVGPQDRDRARQVAPAAKPVPEQPAIESARLVREGRQAFGDGEYGRAAELFLRAARATPDRAEPELLLGQAQIALGKYADAAVAIHRGVRREPTWPANGPPAAELYGLRRADFDEHRRRLDEFATAHPDDLAAQFVRAYLSWFDGRRDAARTAFTALRAMVTDPVVIDLFLNVP